MKLNDNHKKAIAYLVAAIATAISIAFGLTSCGTTKAVIAKPAEGTHTTITITTNNPITTNTNPTLNLETK